MIDTHLYVLNHSVHKIHLDTFFAGGLDEVTGTSSEDMTTGGLASPPSTTFSSINVAADSAEEVVGRE